MGPRKGNHVSSTCFGPFAPALRNLLDLFLTYFSVFKVSGPLERFFCFLTETLTKSERIGASGLGNPKFEKAKKRVVKESYRRHSYISDSLHTV